MGNTENRPMQRAQFRLFLWLIGGLSLVVLFVAIVLRQVNIAPDEAMISEDIDAILFESLIVIAGTFLATVLVVLLIDEYRSRFERNSDEVGNAIRSSGLQGIFRSATDYELIETLQTSIASARDVVRGMGLGLGVLHNNRSLLDAIADRVNSTSHLRVEIYLGSQHNPGVQNRIAEEQNWHKSTGVNYDPAWVQNYPNEIRTVLKRRVDSDRSGRITVAEVDSCPMLGVIQVDDEYYMFPYGTPDVRGSESPWLLFRREGDGTSQVFVQLFERSLDYYGDLARQPLDNQET